VKFQGGREVVGNLKGFDQLVNLVLDDCVEYLRGERERETERESES
jgi:U6 snRNA-associated Sm-like protein LSm7